MLEAVQLNNQVTGPQQLSHYIMPYRAFVILLLKGLVNKSFCFLAIPLFDVPNGFLLAVLLWLAAR